MKMSFLCKSTCEFSAILIKTSTDFWMEVDKPILKFILKRTWNSQENNEEVGRCIISDIKNYYTYYYFSYKIMMLLQGNGEYSCLFNNWYWLDHLDIHKRKKKWISTSTTHHTQKSIPGIWWSYMWKVKLFKGTVGEFLHELGVERQKLINSIFCPAPLNKK